jgi:ribonucleoside-diphosphate reductase alpha chain
MNFQALSDSVYESKYQLKDKFGNLIDQNRLDTYWRVAKALAEREEDSKKWTDEFFWAMKNGAIPGGRILSNAGAGLHKLNTSTLNCTVSRQIDDSIQGISESLQEALLTLSGGSGIGYEFSTLRPRGAFVSGVGARTSGPLPFADIFDKACFTIASAGGRRGAQMATFDLRHPDVIDFIKAKREDGKFRQFNLSVLVPDEFMKNFESDWDFRFPIRKNDPEFDLLADQKNVVNDFWHVEDPAYHVDPDSGLTLFKIYSSMPKTELWDLIMESNYDYAEPGIIYIDTINRDNNLYFCEEIRATNPCGEVPLPPHGSCLLGSIDLTKFVIDPFADECSFDYSTFKKVVRIFTRMLDNVVEINGLPVQGQRDEIFYKRRHGMGIIGLGSALAMLKLHYGSSEARYFAEDVMRSMVIEGYSVGLELAKEKGPAPVMKDLFEVTPKMCRYHEELIPHLGQTVRGSWLWSHSNYMQKLFKDGSLNMDDFVKHGCRFTHHTAVAPTGTISLAMANGASGGLEPSFSHKYFRNLTVEGKKTRQQEVVYSYEALLYKELNGIADEYLLEKLPEYFTTADELSWKEHVDMLACIQYWTDMGTSKTCNVPTEIPYEEFKELYTYAYERGCKSVTTYRYNPETLGSILSRTEDLKKSRYDFVLDDGTVISVKGSDLVEYDGEVTVAENLFNSLKEKNYGKF